jgi:threonine/homoserine/homoserine lactone efflux protein
MEIYTGILLGLSTLLFIGPVFFYLVKSTLEHGLKAGISVALGVMIGDIIYVFMVVEGLSKFLNDPQHKKWLAVGGGVVLIFLGLKAIVKPTQRIHPEGKFLASSYGIFALNGFLLNFINPFVIAVWIGFLVINEDRFQNESSVMLSLGVTLAVIFVTDCLKVVFANKLKPFITKERLKLVYKIFGTVMVLFGIRLLVF